MNDKREKDEKQLNDMISLEDCVETTIYATNAPDCCSAGERVGHLLGMLGADVLDDDAYHREENHPGQSSDDVPKKKFKVSIVEKLLRVVIIEADDQSEAEELADELAGEGVIEIDCECFEGRECSASPASEIDESLFQTFSRDDIPSDEMSVRM